MSDLISRETVSLLANAPIETLITETLKEEQLELPVIHRFGPGIYIRECFIPTGSFIIGHIHKQEHMNVMLQGKLILLNEDGSSQELVAPLCFVAKPGRKSAIIIEDVVWQNIYATDETDIGTLESMFLEDCPQATQDRLSKLEEAKVLYKEDREDYLKAISEFGFTPEVVKTLSEITEDMTSPKYPSQKIRVDESPIEGKGIFATATIEEGEVIYPARISEKRTIAGRYTNHSLNPNAKMELLSNGDLNLVATKKIIGCRGGRVGDEITIDYRQAMGLQWEKGDKVCPQEFHLVQ